MGPFWLSMFNNSVILWFYDIELCCVFFFPDSSLSIFTAQIIDNIAPNTFVLILLPCCVFVMLLNLFSSFPFPYFYLVTFVTLSIIMKWSVTLLSFILKNPAVQNKPGEIDCAINLGAVLTVKAEKPFGILLEFKLLSLPKKNQWYSFLDDVHLNCYLVLVNWKW